jgi:cytochrome b
VICLAVQWFTGEFEFQDLHEIVGVTVLTLVLFRLIWGFVGGEFARFSAFVMAMLAALLVQATLG